MPALLSVQIAITLNQIIFLNYDPFEYEYFSKCTACAVIHVSHTSQITYQAILTSQFTSPQWPHRGVCTNSTDPDYGRLPKNSNTLNI